MVVGTRSRARGSEVKRSSDEGTHHKQGKETEEDGSVRERDYKKLESEVRIKQENILDNLEDENIEKEKKQEKRGNNDKSPIEIDEQEEIEGLEEEHGWSASPPKTVTISPGTSSKRRLIGERFAKRSKKYYKDIRDYAKIYQTKENSEKPSTSTGLISNESGKQKGESSNEERNRSEVSKTKVLSQRRGTEADEKGNENREENKHRNMNKAETPKGEGNEKEKKKQTEVQDMIVDSVSDVQEVQSDDEQMRSWDHQDSELKCKNSRKEQDSMETIESPESRREPGEGKDEEDLNRETEEEVDNQCTMNWEQLYGEIEEDDEKDSYIGETKVMEKKVTFAEGIPEKKYQQTNKRVSVNSGGDIKRNSRDGISFSKVDVNNENKNFYVIAKSQNTISEQIKKKRSQHGRRDYHVGDSSKSRIQSR